MDVLVVKPSDLLKSKYLSKKRGPDGKWVYTYKEPKGRFKKETDDKESGKGSGRHKRYMKTIQHGKESPVREIIVNDDGFVIEMDGKVIEPTPIEDYGDYHLSTSRDKVVKKEAFK